MNTTDFLAAGIAFGVTLGAVLWIAPEPQPPIVTTREATDEETARYWSTRRTAAAVTPVTEYTDDQKEARDKIEVLSRDVLAMVRQAGGINQLSEWDLHKCESRMKAAITLAKDNPGSVSSDYVVALADTANQCFQRRAYLKGY